MNIKLNDDELSYLIISSIGCEYCEELLNIYSKNNEFETLELSIRQIIHIETTTRRDMSDVWEDMIKMINGLNNIKND